MFRTVMNNSPALRLYSHSTIFYWWPVWLVGLVLGVLTRFSGAEYMNADRGTSLALLSGSGPGILYTGLILLSIFITSVKLRGILSIVLILCMAIALIALAWFNMLDDVVAYIPTLSVHMTAGFYFLVSGTIFILWFLGICLFDRLTYWKISEGELTHVRLIGSGERSYGLRGLSVEHRPDDLLRHVIFGFGSGDLILRTAGDEHEMIYLSNVLNANHKRKLIQHLANAAEAGHSEARMETGEIAETGEPVESEPDPSADPVEETYATKEMPEPNSDHPTEDDSVLRENPQPSEPETALEDRKSRN